MGIDGVGRVPISEVHGQAEAIAFDLHRAVAEAGANIGEEGVASRVSIGTGAIDEQGIDDDAILAAADSSMYMAKRAAHKAARRVVTLELERP